MRCIRSYASLTKDDAEELGPVSGEYRHTDKSICWNLSNTIRTPNLFAKKAARPTNSVSRVSKETSYQSGEKSHFELFVNLKTPVPSAFME